MMRYQAMIAALFLLNLTAGSVMAASPVQPLAPIPSLDVQRYMGTWYEIARFPNKFQRQCASDTVATYSLRGDGRINVVNRCRTRDGGEDVATGVARQVGASTSPRLEVRFAPAILSWLPMVWGDYWVIDLDARYQLAAVSEPDRNYLWILSRTPQVDPAAFQALLSRLSAQRLDVSKLVRTSQKR